MGRQLPVLNDHPGGVETGPADRRGWSGRAQVSQSRCVRHSPLDRPARDLRVRSPLLPRRGARPHGRPNRDRGGPSTLPHMGGRSLGGDLRGHQHGSGSLVGTSRHLTVRRPRPGAGPATGFVRASSDSKLSLRKAKPFDLFIPVGGSPEAGCQQVGFNHDGLQPNRSSFGHPPFGLCKKTAPQASTAVAGCNGQPVDRSAPSIPPSDD